MTPRVDTTPRTTEGGASFFPRPEVGAAPPLSKSVTISFNRTMSLPLSAPPRRRFGGPSAPGRRRRRRVVAGRGAAERGRDGATRLRRRSKSVPRVLFVDGALHALRANYDAHEGAREAANAERFECNKLEVSCFDDGWGRA